MHMQSQVLALSTAMYSPSKAALERAKRLCAAFVSESVWAWVCRVCVP